MRRPETFRGWLSALILALFLPLPTTGQSPAIFDAEGRRVVAMGDIHGAFDGMTSILQEAGILDEENRWAGGNAILVQLGDMIDRGSESMRVARFLKDLQQQAPEHGGRVLVLMGNHEVMNLIGDRRYVTPGMLSATFDAEDSASRKAVEASRKENCKLYASQVIRRARALVEYYEDHPEQAGGKRYGIPARQSLRSECMEKTLPGLVEFVQALEPDQEMGAWFRSLPAVAQINGVVFVHGGISPAVLEKTLQEINQQVQEEVTRFDRFRNFLMERDLMIPTASIGQMGGIIQELTMTSLEPDYPADLPSFFDIRDWMLMSSDGPLWFRGFANWTPEQGAAEVPGILEKLGAEHIVVGHSTRKSGRIENPFDNRVFLIDTGMLTEYYNGAPSVLEIDAGRFTAIYLDQRVLLYDPAS